MKDFSSLLARVKAALGSDTALREAIRAAVEECINTTIADADFTVKDGALRLSSGPMLKSEFRLKEAEILRSIEQKAGPHKVVKILYY